MACTFHTDSNQPSKESFPTLDDELPTGGSSRNNLLVVIFDSNPSQRLVRENPEHLTHVLQSTIVLCNTFLMQQPQNILALLACHHHATEFLYPLPGNPPEVRQKNSQYELFTMVEQTVKQRLNDIICNAPKITTVSESLLAGSLAMALCYISRVVSVNNKKVIIINKMSSQNYSKRHYKRMLKKEKEIFVKRLNLPRTNENAMLLEAANELTLVEDFSSNIPTKNNKMSTIQSTLEELKNTVVQQHTAIMEAFAELKSAVAKIAKTNDANKYIEETFPIQTLEQLDELDNNINEANKTKYIVSFTSMLRGMLTKTLTRLLAEDLIMECNVEGIHNKTRLKQFKNFYGALIESIDDKDPEETLKHALRIIKKRIHHNVCIVSIQKKKEKRNRKQY